MRAGWRILIHLFLWGAAQIAASLIIGSPISRQFMHFFPPLAPILDSVLFSVLNLILVFAITFTMASAVDHRAIRTLGLRLDRAWWLDLGFGLLLGIVLMSLVFGVEWWLGWITVTDLFYAGSPDQPFALTIWQPIVLFIVVGINEELLSRGYQLRNLAEGLAFSEGSRAAAIVLAWFISSTLFGLLHIFNPNSTWISTLVLIMAGGCLGMGYVLTGRLGIPIGFHITWNFFQGNVYGFPVSGNVLNSATMIQIEQRGPNFWTGGEFGPEAGMVGVIAILLGAFLTLWWVRWHYGSIYLQRTIATYQPIER